MESNQYALKYNDYQTKIITNLQNLRNNNDFVDVSLCCEDKTFFAHKLMLSACSPYFRKILKENPCSHPIIILKDVSKQTMEDLLLFIYNGEVNLTTHHFEDFIRTAKILHVQGLSDIEDNFNNKTVGEVATGIEDQCKQEDESSVEDVEEILSAPKDFSTNTDNNYRSEILDTIKCPNCKRNYSNLSNLRAHIRNVHSETINWLSCRFCDKKLKTKHYLINHEMSAHGISQRSKRPKTFHAAATAPNKIT